MINSLYNDDCLNILKSINSGAVDFVCVDPPYGIGYDAWDNDGLDWTTLFSEFSRLLKDTGNLIIFQGWSNVCETITIGKQYFTLKNWLIYDRIKGRGAKTNFVSTREDILWFIKSDNYTFNKIYSNIPKKTKGMGEKNGQACRALSNVWTDCSPIVPWSKERVNHPTQKPLQLIQRLVTIFSNENDVILDCFAGSGTTLVAAKNLSRNYIGIEKNKEYFDIIKQRLL